MRNKVSVAEYLNFISFKYKIDPDEIFSALKKAWKNQESVCGDLFLKCRIKNQAKNIFLITYNQKVVAQLAIPTIFFQNEYNPIKDVQKKYSVNRFETIESNKPCTYKIEDLRVGMKNIILRAKVVEISQPKLVFTRFGNYARVSNVSIEDDTGRIKLCLWNEQIDTIAEGDTVRIENAHISKFRGIEQLRIGRKGKLVIVQEDKKEK